MREIRFRGKVVLVRVLHWLGTRWPRRDASAADSPADLPSTPDLLVALSLIQGAGLGLFARRPFAEGEVACEYVGVPLTTLQALHTPDWRYLVGLGTNSRGRRVWVDGRPATDVPARYINHSFDPAKRNIRTEADPDAERWVLRAARPIAADEELYYDYGRLHWYCFDRDLLPTYRNASGN